MLGGDPDPRNGAQHFPEVGPRVLCLPVIVLPLSCDHCAQLTLRSLRRPSSLRAPARLGSVTTHTPCPVGHKEKCGHLPCHQPTLDFPSPSHCSLGSGTDL